MSTGSPAHSLFTRPLSARPARPRLHSATPLSPKPNQEPVRRLTGIFSFPVGNVDVTDPWQNDEKRNEIHTIQLMIEDLFLSSNFGNHTCTSLNQSTTIGIETLDKGSCRRSI